MRPTFQLDGQPAPALDRDLIEAAIDERADAACCRVVWLNWGDVGGVPGYLHFDAGLAAGRALHVALDDDLVFAGVVDALEARYPAGQAPSLAATASGRLTAPADAGAPAFRLGATLRDCVVRTSHAAADGQTSTTAEATVGFDSRVRVGAAVLLAGLGASVDGTYAIVEARHRYDPEHGLRSGFSAVRRAWIA